MKSGFPLSSREFAWTLCIATCLTSLNALCAQSEKQPAPSTAPVASRWLDPTQFTKLWTPYGEGSTSAQATWSIRNTNPAEGPILVCTGKPEGYLRTTERFEDFVLKLEWKYPTDPNGNSGILVHIDDKDRVWPRSMQIQLHMPTVGSAFPFNGATTANVLAPARFVKFSPQDWNRCEIISLDGVLRVSMNDHLLGDVAGCNPSSGFVALQSEGAEVHFRKIEIRPLTAADQVQFSAPVTLPIRTTAQYRRQTRWQRRMSRTSSSSRPQTSPLNWDCPSSELYWNAEITPNSLSHSGD